MDSRKRRQAKEPEKDLHEHDPEDASDEEADEVDENVSGDDDDSGSDGSGSELEAVFEGFTPKEGDFHGIKNLLNQLLPGFDVNLSELADVVLSQPDVTSVLKVDDGDDEVFGVVCPLHLQKHAEVAAVKSVRQLILGQCRTVGSATANQQISSAIGDGSKQKVALLINERMINLPQELGLSLFGALEEDLKAHAQEDRSFNFDSFLVLCKSVESKQRKTGAGQEGQKKKKKASPTAAAAAANGDGSERLFTNVEDEILQKHSTCSFSFPVPETQWVSRRGGIRERPCRTVLLLSKKQFRDSCKDLQLAFT